VIGLLQSLDFSGVREEDATKAKAAIARGESFYGYIPSQGLAVVVKNYRALAAMGVLEESWLDAYVFASHFQDYEASTIRAVFDACDRGRLLKLKPLMAHQIKAERVSIFRGCAGPRHAMSMSWTSSLDKAIWYAAKYSAYHELTNVAVYAATVATSEIYCRLDHNEEEFIVVPGKAWRVDVQDEEFRLDRPR
jgi:hypothetical protein